MKKGLLLAGLLQAFLTLPLLAAPAVVEFVSQPAGAAVIVDGERRGTTPLKLANLGVGVKHHVRFELRDYETVDEFLKLADGEVLRKDVVLSPVKGLLLVTSDPAGAEVTQNGYSLGTTPRLIASLNVKESHTLMLRKPGYQDGKLAVRFDGRRPLVQNVKLVLDSGIITVRTEPEGAEVTVNGIARGASPTTVNEVSKGRVVVEVKKAGYKSETRELVVGAGDNQQVFVRLEALPSSLRLTSVPSGARFYLNDEPLLGGDPCVKEGLPPGTYRVRAELKGYGTQEKMITLTNGSSEVAEFRLENVMGTMELKNLPVGSAIYVDGRRYGTSTSADPNSATSDLFVVRNQLAGDHEVRIECQGYAPWTGHLLVRSSEAVRKEPAMKKIFVPNIRLTLSSGEVIEGVIESDDGSTVVVQTSLKMTRPIPRDRIRKREAIFAP